MLKVAVSIIDDRWLSKIPLVDQLAEEILYNANEQIPNGDNSELSVILADDELLQKLNKKYRSKDKPTNILSFPMHENDSIGDLYLAFETSEQEAIEQKKPLVHHLSHLLIHGYLHLMGYDHEEELEAQEMEKIEVEILEKMQIPNPYEMK